jgi:hypothetical protein
VNVVFGKPGRVIVRVTYASVSDPVGCPDERRSVPQRAAHLAALTLASRSRRDGRLRWGHQTIRPTFTSLSHLKPDQPLAPVARSS